MGRRMHPFTTAFMTTAVLLAGPALADAAAVVQSYQYATSANIANAAGVHSIGLIGNYSSTSATSPATFNLGTFYVGPLLPGETDSFQNTPFTVDLKLGTTGTSVGDLFSSPGVTDYQINGVLNGSISGDGTSTLFPSIASVSVSGATPPFPVSALSFNLPVIAAASNGLDGTTTLTAAVNGDANPLPSPAPEPTSVAVFAAALLGWAWRRRRLASRTVPA